MTMKKSTLIPNDILEEAINVLNDYYFIDDEVDVDVADIHRKLKDLLGEGEQHIFKHNGQ